MLTEAECTSEFDQNLYISPKKALVQAFQTTIWPSLDIQCTTKLLSKHLNSKP